MQIWDQIYAELSSRMDSHLKTAILDEVVFKEVQNGDTIVLNVSGDFIAGWFNENVLALTEETALDLTGKPYRVRVEVSPTVRAHEKAVTKAKVPESKKAVEAKNLPFSLDPNYTFEHYIIGDCNDFAHAAAFNVAQFPGQSYNPLFIHGDVALGKTHLMQAVAHYVLENHPDKKVLYITSENFVNDFVEARLSNQWSKFRDKYRNVDVLIIDDIQFFQDKDKSRAELFNTFNELFHSRKQMIFACDRPPQSLTAIEDRLRTRFSSGLTVEVKKPSYETRVAILLKRLEEENAKRAQDEQIKVSEKVLAFIAKNIDSNVRLLGSSLVRLIAFSDLKRKHISLEMAREVLSDQIKIEPPKNLTIPQIQKAVAKYFNITVSDIKSGKRMESVAYPRQIAMYLSKQYTDLSLTEIGQMFGNKAHTTVMRSADKITDLVRGRRKKVKRELDEILASFYNEN